MKSQNQQNYATATHRTRLLYAYPHNFSENGSEMLKLYLKELTFQGMVDPMIQLNNEEIEKLRRIIDKVYDTFVKKQINLVNVQGIWPLLTFSFQRRCGLELYLHFENLMEPIDYRRQIIKQNIKVEHTEQSNPRGYFQNNKWKDNKRFMKSLRTLERQLAKDKLQAQSQCMQMFKYLSIQEGDTLQRQTEFKAKLNDFFNKITKQIKQKEINSKQLIFTKAFASRMFFQQQNDLNQQYLVSEPDILHSSILGAFTYEQYNKIHNAKSLAKLIPSIIEEQDYKDYKIQQQHPPDNEASARFSTTIRNRRDFVDRLSSPTKRRMPGTKANSNKKRQIKRPPRKMMVNRFFELQRNRNLILEEIKRQKKRKKDIHNKRKRRLDRIQKKIYKSDQQNDKKQYKKRQKRDQIQDDSDYQQESKYSHSNQPPRILEKQLQPESQQDIIMKRKRNNYKRPQLIQHYIEEDSYDQSHFIQDEVQHDKMDIEVEKRDINTKTNPYAIGKIRPMNLDQSKALQNLSLSNLDIRKLVLDQAYEFQHSIAFDKYKYYLSHLQGKQIKKQVEKIISQVIIRQNITFDIDLTIKIIVAWTMSKNKTQKMCEYWQEMTKSYIFPLLKFVISTNVYRSITEVLNNFFVSAQNEDLAELNKARQYFRILFETGRSFSKFDLDEIIMKIFYESMVTPKKLAGNTLKTNYFAECQMVSLRNPFKIGASESKFKLNQKQDKIVFLVGSLVIQALLLQGLISNISSNSNLSNSKQQSFKNKFFKTRKAFLNNLRQQLKEVKKNEHQQWIYNLTNTIKKFYKIYDPNLDNEYFFALVSIVNLSLQKLIIETVTTENDVQAKNQTQFLKQLIIYYVKIRKVNKNLPDFMNSMTIITGNSGIKSVLDKDSLFSFMAYSSVLRMTWNLLINQQCKDDRRDLAINSYFMKYLKDRIENNLFKIISPLKPNYYRPVFQLISQIYTYQIQIRLKNNIDNYLGENAIQHKIKSIIQKLWESIENKYTQVKHNLHMSEKLNQNHDSMPKIQENIDKCQRCIKIFLRNFLLPQVNNQQNQSQNNLCLKQSLTHYTFGFDFILKQKFFLKYLIQRQNQQKKGQIQKVILQILQFWLQSPKIYRQNKNLEQNYYNKIFDLQLKKTELAFLIQSNDQNLHKVYGLIYGVQFIAAAKRPKLVNPPECMLMNLVKKNIGQRQVRFRNIKKSIYCLNVLFQRLYFHINQNFALREVNHKKQYIWQNLIYFHVKDIVLLIILGFIAQHDFDYQNIPLKNMIKSLNSIINTNFDQRNQNKTAYQLVMQNLQQFDNISDILASSAIQKDNNLQLILRDLFPLMKTLWQRERNKQPVVIESIRILSFILKMAKPQFGLIKFYLKDLQLISKVNSLITKIHINQHNIQLLMKLFKQIKNNKDKPHNIGQIQAIYIESFTKDSNQKDNQHFKLIKRLLNSIRNCLMNDVGLKDIVHTFLRQFLIKFCSVDVLASCPKQIRAEKLQIFFEMMKNSLLQRQVYEKMVVENRRKYEQLIPLLLQRSNQNKYLYANFESAILTSMIGRYSNLLDIKFLLGTLRKDNDVQIRSNQTKKKLFLSLFHKLRAASMEANKQYAQQMEQWCMEQIKQMTIDDLFDEQQSMDIEQ